MKNNNISVFYLVLNLNSMDLSHIFAFVLFLSFLSIMLIWNMFFSTLVGSNVYQLYSRSPLERQVLMKNQVKRKKLCGNLTF